MPSESTLTLFIPDLFGFQSTLNNLSSEEKSSLPPFKIAVLEKWLSRGSFEESSDQDSSVFLELGLDEYINSDKPYAAFTLLAEKNKDIEVKQNSYWLRADPVNLQADRDTALLAGHEELALTQDEANELVTQINEHFIDEPWQLYTFAPHRWYIRFNKPINLRTTPLAKVLGEDINSFSPTGEDANYWFKILNELQMLIHGSNVNFNRDSRNMLMANSIWLWGGGCLPEVEPNSNYDKIITDNHMFSGIAYHCRLKSLSLDCVLSENIKTKNNFMTLDVLSKIVQRRDLYTFVQTLNKLENDFLMPCNELLLNGTIGKVKLITDVGVFSVTKKQLGRWWKRIKPFSGFNYA